MLYSGVVQRSERVAYNRLMEGSIPPPRISEENKMDMMNRDTFRSRGVKIKQLKKEIIRLKSLNRRAADEIRELDNIIIDLVEGVPRKISAGEASINLLNRLDGRTSGAYVENYEDLHLEMKAIDGE